MMAFSMTSPAEILQAISDRLKQRRIDAGLTQRELAERAGVPYGSLRVLEEKGKASLEAVVKVAFALQAEAEFDTLFPPRKAMTIDDVIERPKRQRAARRTARRQGDRPT